MSADPRVLAALDANNAVRRRMDVKEVSFATAADAIALTGMPIGGVTELGLPESTPLRVDAAGAETPTGLALPRV